MKKPVFRESLRRRNALQSTVIGVAWYTRENWTRIKATAHDPELFEPTYADWVAMADAGLDEIRKCGVKAEKCHLDADVFFAWCLMGNRRNAADSRAEFVVERMRLLDLPPHAPDSPGRLRGKSA